MIILDAASAAGVRGCSKPGFALAPVPLVMSGASASELNGAFALPETVLADPAHSAFWDVLSVLPRFDDKQILKTDWETNPTRELSFSFDAATWLPGQLVIVTAE